MPYEVRESTEDPGEFDVVNTLNDDVKDTFGTRGEAERMVETLHELEKDGEGEIDG